MIGDLRIGFFQVCINTLFALDGNRFGGLTAEIAPVPRSNERSRTITLPGAGRGVCSVAGAAMLSAPSSTELRFGQLAGLAVHT